MPKEKKELSPAVKSVLTLLNNVRELLIVSNKRQEAKDVMMATEIYAESKQIAVPKDKIQMFYCRLFDSRPLTLITLISDIGHQILSDEKAKLAKLNKKKKLENDKLENEDADYTV